MMLCSAPIAEHLSQKLSHLLLHPELSLNLLHLFPNLLHLFPNLLHLFPDLLHLLPNLLHPLPNLLQNKHIETIKVAVTSRSKHHHPTHSHNNSPDQITHF
jgi:hypothetical protein